MTHTGPARPAKRKPARGRGLNALQLAEEQNLDEPKIRQHRLGESYEDDSDENTRQDADERSTKRRKVEEDNEDDSGSDPEGERWHVGVDEEDEDSDIDSEDAFGESDEDRFADFSFRGSAKGGGKAGTSKARKKAASDDESDASEEAEEIEDDFGDEGIDLAAALDMDSEEEEEEEQADPKQKRLPKPVHDDEDDEDESEPEGSGSDAEDDAESELSVSDAEDGDHTRLQTFVEGLSRKSEIAPSKEQRGSTRAKISAADLLQYVKDPHQRQSLKVLQNSEAKGPELYKGGIPGRLAPPLAKRQQDRLDRVAAYDESKKELDKWVDTVKQNRRAEHVSFPLPDPDGAPSRNDKFMPVTSAKPMSALEAKIQDIMRESGMLSKGAEDKEEQEYEELEEQKLPPEEIQARRAELRKARDLMFREELRSKRIKKIKSKAYRRVHRKERDKAALEKRAQMSAQGLIDSDDEKEQNDKRRAEERMGSRHRESRWAKAAKAAGRTVWDEDARVGVSDMARRDDELRRRIEGKAAGSSDESGSDSDAYSSDEADEDVRQRLRDDDIRETTAGGKSKLADMAFMRKAEAARKAANDAEIHAIRQSMHNEDLDGDSDSDTDNSGTGGRLKFGGDTARVQAAAPTKKPPKTDFEERLSDDDGHAEEVENASFPVAGHSTHKSRAAPVTGQKTSSATSTSKPTDQARTISRAEIQKTKTALPKPRPQIQKLNDQVSDSSDAEDGAGGEQETLADTVFMGPDDLVRDFDKEKKEIIEEEGDQIIDNSLPGWGSWGGVGINKKKQNADKSRSIVKVKGTAPEARKDAKLDRVIINEKRVKKNGKYLATELPHPYESRSQYERAMRLPLGPEWTTKSTFQDATKPRVLVKQGIIKPMARPMV